MNGFSVCDSEAITISFKNPKYFTYHENTFLLIFPSYFFNSWHFHICLYIFHKFILVFFFSFKTEAPQYLETAFRGEYNGVQLLKCDYKSDSMSSAGLEKENKQLELDNHFWPFGFNHTYQYEYSGGYEGSNLPTKVKSKYYHHDNFPSVYFFSLPFSEIYYKRSVS